MKPVPPVWGSCVCLTHPTPQTSSMYSRFILRHVTFLSLWHLCLTLHEKSWMCAHWKANNALWWHVKWLHFWWEQAASTVVSPVSSASWTVWVNSLRIKVGHSGVNFHISFYFKPSMSSLLFQFTHFSFIYFISSLSPCLIYILFSLFLQWIFLWRCCSGRIQKKSGCSFGTSQVQNIFQ